MTTDTVTTLDTRTSLLLDAYLDGSEIIVAKSGPCAWPVLYSPRKARDRMPWAAWYDGTRYRSNEVRIK